jgi:hypothetical protein
MEHHFNTEIAQEYGVNEAIMLYNICFWQNRHVANNTNFHDGKFWVYNTVEAFSKLFPYFSAKQIRLILQKIEKKGCVSVGRYNKMKIDRTKWYSATSEIMSIHGFLTNSPKGQMQQTEKAIATDQKGNSICPNGQKEKPKRAKGKAQKGKAIPNNKPDNNNLIINTNKNTYRAFAHLSLSELEFEKLLLNNTKEEIDDILDSIENFKNNKKYKSLFLTAKSWIKKSFSNEKRSSENFNNTGVQKSKFEKMNEVYTETQKILDSDEYKKQSQAREIWVDPLA